MKKFIVAFAAAGALTAATALPATATAISDGDSFPTVNGVTWGDIYADEYGDGFNVDDAYTSDENDAYDGAGYFQWYEAAGDQWSDYVTCFGGDITEDADHPGDYVLTCDPDVDLFTGLTSQVAGRLYAEGDMLRLEYTLTNTSNSTLDVSWASENYYGDSSIDDSPGLDLERGFDIQNATYGYDEGIAFGLPGAPQTPNDLGVIDVDNDYLTVWGPETYHALEPGKSVTIALFYFHDMAGSTNPYPSAESANLSEWATTAFADWNERLSRGIADDVFVANWMDEAPATDNGGLANTGTDVTGALALGGAALVAGAVAVIARRRRTV